MWYDLKKQDLTVNSLFFLYLFFCYSECVSTLKNVSMKYIAINSNDSISQIKKIEYKFNQSVFAVFKN